MAERIHQIHLSDDALRMAALCILCATAGAAQMDEAAALALSRMEVWLAQNPAKYAAVQDELFKQFDVDRLKQ